MDKHAEYEVTLLASLAIVAGVTPSPDELIHMAYQQTRLQRYIEALEARLSELAGVEHVDALRASINRRFPVQEEKA